MIPPNSTPKTLSPGDSSVPRELRAALPGSPLKSATAALVTVSDPTPTSDVRVCAARPGRALHLGRVLGFHLVRVDRHLRFVHPEYSASLCRRGRRSGWDTPGDGGCSRA